AESNLLGAPLFETLNRQRREIRRELPIAGGNQKWGEEEWPAERIIEYYGPATWANNGSWRYRTPIYLLNRLIRLQAVVEVVSNHTSEALELLAKQHSQMRAFVYQNRLALDYLLAEEGGVCGRFNESECCIEIDDYEETIKGLAQEIKKHANFIISNDMLVKMTTSAPGPPCECQQGTKLCWLSMQWQQVIRVSDLPTEIRIVSGFFLAFISNRMIESSESGLQTRPGRKNLTKSHQVPFTKGVDNEERPIQYCLSKLDFHRQMSERPEREKEWKLAKLQGETINIKGDKCYYRWLFLPNPQCVTMFREHLE
ncbi:hypothetical protein HGM15179_008229, partial [Zosterops borbonicus]